MQSVISNTLLSIKLSVKAERLFVQRKERIITADSLSLRADETTVKDVQHNDSILFFEVTVALLYVLGNELDDNILKMEVNTVLRNLTSYAVNARTSEACP